MSLYGTWGFKSPLRHQKSTSGAVNVCSSESRRERVIGKLLPVFCPSFAGACERRVKVGAL